MLLCTEAREPGSYAGLSPSLKIGVTVRNYSHGKRYGIARIWMRHIQRASACDKQSGARLSLNGGGGFFQKVFDDLDLILFVVYECFIYDLLKG